MRLPRLRTLARLLARHRRHGRASAPPASLPQEPAPEWAAVGRVLRDLCTRAEDARAAREQGDLSDRVALDQVIAELRYARTCADGEEELVTDSMHTMRVVQAAPRRRQPS